jgi:phage protein D
LQATYAAQQAAFEAQLEESRRAIDRNAAQQAEYANQLEESRLAAIRHNELLTANERSQARQDAQLDVMDALLERWASLADKVERLIDGSNS